MIRSQNRFAPPQCESFGTMLGQAEHSPDRRRRDVVPGVSVSSFEIRDCALGVPRGDLIFQTEDSLGTSGIALACPPTEQLPVDPGRLVWLGSDHVESSQFGDPSAERDVSASPCHVRGNRDSSLLTRPCDNLRLLAMMYGVKNLMIEMLSFKQPA
jgi:hypothetical protein